jgi:hypothetical protein
MIRWLITTALLLLPSVSHACAVCFSATDQNRMAFIETTVLMSLLPLGMIGGVVYYYRRKSRQMAEEEAESHR